MAKHPADPRSDALGEIPFDPNEYPGRFFEPAAPPPPTPNVRGFVPYRGGEQHGVPFQESGAGFQPYLHEQLAQNRVVDPNITPRDIDGIDPIKVEIVANPTLIEPRNNRFMSYYLPPSATYSWSQVIQPEKLRKRCVITATGSAGGAVTLRLAHAPDAIEPNSMYRRIAVGTELTILDSECQNPVYIWVITATDPTAIISVCNEYYSYDGSKLI